MKGAEQAAFGAFNLYILTVYIHFHPLGQTYRHFTYTAHC
jgi:hypothetical protein